MCTLRCGRNLLVLPISKNKPVSSASVRVVGLLHHVREGVLVISLYFYGAQIRLLYVNCLTSLSTSKITKYSQFLSHWGILPYKLGWLSTLHLLSLDFEGPARSFTSHSSISWLPKFLKLSLLFLWGFGKKQKLMYTFNLPYLPRDPPDGFQRYNNSYVFHSILLLLRFLPIVCYSLFAVLVLVMLSLVSMTFPFLCAYLTCTAFQLLLSFWDSLDKFSFTYHVPHHFWHPFICSLELRLGSWLFSLLLLLFDLTIWEGVRRRFPLGLGTYGRWTRILHFKILHQCSGYIPRGTLDPYHNSVEPQTHNLLQAFPYPVLGFLPRDHIVPFIMGGEKAGKPTGWGPELLYRKGEELHLGSSPPSSLGPLPTKELCLAFSFIFHPAKSLLFAKIKISFDDSNLPTSFCSPFFQPRKNTQVPCSGIFSFFPLEFVYPSSLLSKLGHGGKAFQIFIHSLTLLKCQVEVKSCFFP